MNFLLAAAGSQLHTRSDWQRLSSVALLDSDSVCQVANDRRLGEHHNQNDGAATAWSRMPNLFRRSGTRHHNAECKKVNREGWLRIDA